MRTSERGERLFELARRGRGPAGAILGAVVLGAALMALSGYDPLAAYSALVDGAVGGRGGSQLAATLNRAAPIVGMALGAALAFRAGLVNLGGEGQLIFGALGATLVGLYVPAGPATPLICLLVAALAGGLWALLPGWLQFRFGVPLLLSSLLLSYPARYLASYLVNHPLRDVPSGMPQSHRLVEAATLPTFPAWPRLQLSFVFIVGLVALATFVLRRSSWGYEVRISGWNPRFARYGGVDLERLGYQVLAASGGAAGLVGGLLVLAVHHRLIDGSLTTPLYAWIGIMVALLARSHPLGVLAAGLFFAGLQTGSLGMERQTEVPRELSQILQALVLLLVAAWASARFGTDEEEGA